MSTGKLVDALANVKRSRSELETRITNAYATATEKHFSDYAPEHVKESLDDLITKLSYATNLKTPSLPAKSKLKLQRNIIPYGKVVPDPDHPNDFLYGANAYPDLGRGYKMRPTTGEMNGLPAHIAFIPNFSGVDGVIGWYYIITVTSFLYQYTIYTNESYPTVKLITVVNTKKAISDLSKCWIVPMRWGTPEVFHIGIFEKTTTGNKRSYIIDPASTTLNIDTQDASWATSGNPPIGDNLLSCTRTALLGKSFYAWNDTKGYLIKFNGTDVECAALGPDTTTGAGPTPSCVYRDPEGRYCVLRNKGNSSSVYSYTNKYHDEALTNRDNVYSYIGEATIRPNDIPVEMLKSYYHKNAHSPFTDRDIVFASVGSWPGSYLNGLRTNPTLRNVIDSQRFGDFVFGVCYDKPGTEPLFFVSGSNLLSRPLTAFGSALLVAAVDGGVDKFPSAQIVVDDTTLTYTFGDTLAHQKNADVFASIEEITFQKRVTPESPEYCKISARNLGYSNVWPYMSDGAAYSWYCAMRDPRLLVVNAHTDNIDVHYSDRAFFDFYPDRQLTVRLPLNGTNPPFLNTHEMSGIYDVLIVFRSDLPDHRYGEDSEGNALRIPLNNTESFFDQTIAPIALDKLNVPYFKLTI